MPRTCTVCADARVERIDEQLVSGTPLRNIAEQFRLAPTSLHRHRHAHIPAALAQGQHATVVAHADSLLSRLAHLTTEAHRLKCKAERDGDLRTSLAAVRELVRIVELMAKVSGQMAPVTQQVNLAVMPQWRLVVESLTGFPEAKVAVARALERELRDDRFKTKKGKDERDDVNNSE